MNLWIFHSSPFIVDMLEHRRHGSLSSRWKSQPTSGAAAGGLLSFARHWAELVWVAARLHPGAEIVAPRGSRCSVN